MRLYIFLSILILSMVNIVSNVSANPLAPSSQKPATQEQLEEKELEALYGMDVERNRLGRGSIESTTRDRYGDGRIGVFQEHTESARNHDTHDSIGLEVKLFEFK